MTLYITLTDDNKEASVVVCCHTDYADPIKLEAAFLLHQDALDALHGSGLELNFFIQTETMRYPVNLSYPLSRQLPFAVTLPTNTQSGNVKG